MTVRFDAVAIQGIGPFRSRVEIDFAGIPGLLVALVGENGAGKSTLLECLGGALFRKTPTRGTLASLATDRNSYVETRVVNGASYCITQTVDAISGKGKALVIDGNGQSLPELQSDGVKEYDAWAAKHLPSPEVLYSSTFAPQGSGGILEMTEGARKGLVLRVLGIEAYERKAEKARERATATKKELDLLLARIGDERARGLDTGQAEEQIALARSRAEEADAALKLAQAELEDAQEKAAETRAKITEEEANQRRIDELQVEITALRMKWDELTARIENNQGVLKDADAIRAAVVRDPEIALELSTLAADESKVDAERVAHGREAETLVRFVRDAQVRFKAAQERLGRAGVRLRDRAAIERAVADLPQLREDVAEAEREETRAQQEADVWRNASLNVAERRIDVLRPAIDKIASTTDGGDGNNLACDAILEDDQIQQEASAAPGLLQKADAVLDHARADLRNAREALRGAESLAARVQEIEGAKADFDAATAEGAQLQEEIRRTGEAIGTAKRTQLAAGQRLSEIRAARAALEQERQQLAQILPKAVPLEKAEARLAELRPQREELKDKLRALVEQIRDIEPDPTNPSNLGDPDEPVRIAKDRLPRVEENARVAHGMIAVAEARLNQARLSQRKVDELNSQRSAVEADLADWTLLAQSLGKDGLQALEVDAAGPEWTELTNDLLHKCVSTRWTVSIATTRPNADGKKEVEGCFINVLDLERGRDAPGETLSGGERVLINEALSLALSMLQCRRTGAKGPTLIRDESGAALDPTNARAYIAMLRRAAEIIGASKVLFVSHSPEVQELADARIEIKDGEVRVAA